MNVREISSYGGTIQAWGKELNERDRLARILFAVATKPLRLPDIDTLTSCDKIKSDLAKANAKGLNCYVLYQLGSGPEEGYLEIKAAATSLVGVTWLDKRLFEVKVHSPSPEIFREISPSDARCMLLTTATGTCTGDEAVALISSLVKPNLFSQVW